MAQDKSAPTIIKRKKIIVAGGHHGGAWKVAYADFVTAMMAFFLMMWLLNATTEDQRKGLADYFSPSIPVSKESGGSDGALNGRSVMDDDTLIGQPADGASTEGGANKMDAEFEEIAKQFDASSGESKVADELLEHIEVRITDEGLIVDLFDLPGATLFRGESAEPTPLMRDLIGVVDEIFSMALNPIAVNGHVREEAVVRQDSAPWTLSTDRAERARRMLVGGFTNAQRIRRLGGFGDASNIHPDGMDVRNNRIELILLRNL